MKVALVYDRVSKIGGAERVLEILHEIWPEAPLYTLVYSPASAPWADKFEVRTSFLQKLPIQKSMHEWWAWLAPLAFRRLDFSDYDVIISVTSAEAKDIVVPKKTLHVCYCLTPTRYFWSGKEMYEKRGARAWGLKLLAPVLRLWDFEAAQKPDVVIAISQTVKERIKNYYCREAEVIYPPAGFLQGPALRPVGKAGHDDLKTPFYLIVSRLVAYKRVDLAVAAFNELGKRLIIVGEGEEERRLKVAASDNIIFAGCLTDEELVGYYGLCSAVIFPGEEDFGLVAVEALAAGRPVIGYGKGGISEIIKNIKTGLLFDKQSVESLREAVLDFEKRKWDPVLCRKESQKFSTEIFKQKIRSFVEAEWRKHKQVT